MNRGFLKSEMIGSFFFDLAGVYFSDDHKIEHAWAALNNLDSEDFDEIKGMLKMSLSVTGPKDNAIKLDNPVGPEPSQMKMLMTAQTKRTFYQLKLRFIEGRDLPEFSSGLLGGDSLEAYIKC